MFKSYWKIAFRSLWKNKHVTFINIFGLAIGIACSLLIFLFVQDENSYDRFYKDAQNIHRVVKDFINDDGSRIPDATSPGPLATAIKRDIPEIEHVTRLFPAWGNNRLVKYKNKKINESRYFRADSTFFDVFNLPFIRGNKKTALPDAESVVITESIAKKYFNNEDPLGKTLLFDSEEPLKVTGVIADVPSNSHIHFDFLASNKQLGVFLDTAWGSYNHYTYIRVKEGPNMAGLDDKIQAVYERYQSSRYSDFYTQPLVDIHLASHLKWEIEPNSDKLYVNIFTLIAVFILLIAAINYINLATAKSSLRAKEIGVRKVSGAHRRMLVMQFLFESVIICAIASVIAIVLAHALTPFVNNLTLKNLSVLNNKMVWLYLPVITVLIGVIAGLFPSLYLSSFKPVIILKGYKLSDKNTLSLRKALVVVQFTISIALIVGSLIIVQQMNYISNAKLGIDKDQVVTFKNTFSMSRSQLNSFVSQVKQLPEVKNASPAASEFGALFGTNRLRKKGSDKENQLNLMGVGFDFLDVLGIEIKNGRGFSGARPSDSMMLPQQRNAKEMVLGGIVINERAVRDFGIDSPYVGQQFVWNKIGDTSLYVEVIGVAKDFNFTSLRNEIKPFGFVVRPYQYSNVTAKLSTMDMKATIAKIERIWNGLSPEYPFEYTFLDETFAKLYSAESRFKTVFIILVVISIVISCLGLFALAAFSAEQRIKEIGIRKVLGASVTNLVTLLSKDYLKLVIISLVIAIPVSWYAMNQWLQDFAYRINIQWWTFAFAAVIAVLIAVATVSFQAIKAALANPANTLKTE
ncbi:MAG: ABC transporter permease [Chitinophagaceae bacterium]|nr:ABC transporter permease [Chitinophagaceae bacterium]